MRKFSIIFLSLSMMLLLTACASKKMPPSVPSSGNPTAQMTETIENVKDIMRYSDCVVLAKLLTEEDFDGSTMVYKFCVQKDYLGTSDKIIHVYGKPNNPYVNGHEYYLFLNRGDDALYPHAIYSFLAPELILDANTDYMTNEEKVITAANADKIIRQMIDKGVVGELAPIPIQISEKDDPRDIAKEADAIAIIQVTKECNFNPYVSAYSVISIHPLKGGDNTVSQQMLLPPNLSPNTDYYIFLKENPNYEGNYLLFSHKMPVLRVTDDVSYLAKENAD